MTKIRKYLLVSACVVSAFFTAATSAQAVIVSAVGGTIESGGPGFGTLTETHNQAGLSSGYISGVTDFDAYIASGPRHTEIFAGFEWFSNIDTTSATVTYDLGSILNINKFALWNEESSGIGVLDLLTSADGVTFTSLLSGLIASDNPVTALNTGYLADVFVFGTTAMRYFRMEMSGCPQPDPGSFPSCAIGEVAFNSASVIPLPAALPLFATGLGIVAWLSRRKRSHTLPTAA